MKIIKRPAGERGHTDLGWLDSHHTFSFGDYHDPTWMGFHGLRVINEDRVVPGAGFGRHGHREMEIVTYVLKGALSHADSMGHERTINARDAQGMSAGSGVQHSEYNASQEHPVHFVQIWIEPDPAKRNLPPAYAEWTPLKVLPAGEFMQLIASPSGKLGSIPLRQNAHIRHGELKPGESITHACAREQAAWIQQLYGSLTVTVGEERIELAPGDGLGIEGDNAITLAADASSTGESGFLVFDLP